jgi:hypothetical protein
MFISKETIAILPDLIIMDIIVCKHIKIKLKVLLKLHCSSRYSCIIQASS